MKLNWVEKALMNNPVRRWSQVHYEARLLEQFGGKLPGTKVLEIGCGQGVGTELILTRFLADRVEAIDIDEDMIRLARKRLSRFGERVALKVGDASALEAEDGRFDAVFDFGIIHHVPDWRSAVAEVARVLRPGGRFYFEEVTKQALDRWLYRTFLEHPTQDRFSADEFMDFLERQNIAVGARYAERLMGDFFIGVGIKQS